MMSTNHARILADNLDQAAKVIRELCDYADSKMQDIAGEVLNKRIGYDNQCPKNERVALSVRARKALRRHGVETVKDILKLSEDDLRETKNCGESTVNEIRDFLQTNHLDFALPNTREMAR